MKNQLKERWPCMVGLSFFILLDGVVTLLGQSEGYWTNQSSPNERSAVGYILLEYSPIVFFVGIIRVFLASLQKEKNFTAADIWAPAGGNNQAVPAV